MSVCVSKRWILKKIVTLSHLKNNIVRIQITDMHFKLVAISLKSIISLFLFFPHAIFVKEIRVFAQQSFLHCWILLIAPHCYHLTCSSISCIYCKRYLEIEDWSNSCSVLGQEYFIGGSIRRQMNILCVSLSYNFGTLMIIA